MNRWVAVWRRNFSVWKKLLIPSIFGNFGEPLIYLIALGYGLGRYVGTLDGIPYVVFLASGIVCSSAMNTASFESMYSAYTRMHMQQTWTAMITAPLSVNDVVLGELMWIATKSSMSAIAIMIVGAGLGLFNHWQALWCLPVIFLTGCCFGAMGLMMTSIAKGYDFFMYYFTLILTPMMMLSGVFFPLSGMPEVVQKSAMVLPLYHAIMVIRPYLTGAPVQHLIVHVAVILCYSCLAFWLASRLIQKRLCA